MTTDRSALRLGHVQRPDYVAYHDDEWGVPLHGDRALFERLSPGGVPVRAVLADRSCASGRPSGPRSPASTSTRSPRSATHDVERLLADAGIVRNRAKIEAAITNARAVRDAVPEGLDALLWSFAPGRRTGRPATLADVPAITAGVDRDGQGAQAARASASSARPPPTR